MQFKLITHLPWPDEELVLNQEIDNEEQNAQHKHGEEIAAHDVPRERIWESVFPELSVHVGKQLVFGHVEESATQTVLGH